MSASARTARPVVPAAPGGPDGAGRPVRVRARRIIAVAAGVAAAAAAWAVAGPLAGTRLLAQAGAGSPARPVTLASVITVSLLAGAAGWALLTVLERTASRPRRTWTIFAVAVLVLSLTGPLATGHGTAAVVALSCLHLVTGGVLIAALAPTARRIRHSRTVPPTAE